MTINKEKVQQWLPHVIVLLFVVILPLFVFDQSDAKIKLWLYRYYHQLFLIIIAFYANYLIFVPRFLFKRNNIRFFVMMITLTVFLLALSQVLSDNLDYNKPPPGEERETNHYSESVKREPHPFSLHPRLYDDALILILVLGFSTGMRIIQHSRQEQNEQRELERVHFETELAFLKNQINPHFFFNSLNNIYALVAIDSDEAQKAIEKLSGLMRYLIYESDIKTVPMKKEFEFTGTYIDLMKQRLTPEVRLEVNIQQDVIDVEIPPLIFIPFVENAFKHGISYREDSFIDISLRVKDQHIIFECKNSVPKLSKLDATKDGGVGLVNIKKRLHLLYGRRAQLTQTEENDQFAIELVLPLNIT